LLPERKGNMLNNSIIFCLLLIFLSGTAFAESNSIGTVKTATGTVMVARNDVQNPVDIGFKIHQNDLISTGKKGAVGIIFTDDTILSLGPNTKLVMDEYVFAPQKKEMSMIMRLIKGTASYLSGIIGKQSPDTVKLKTPEATIGMRGTRFLVKVD